MYLIILPAGLPLLCQAAWIKEFNFICLMAFFLHLQNTAFLFGLLSLQVKNLKFLKTCLSTC